MNDGRTTKPDGDGCGPSLGCAIFGVIGAFVLVALLVPGIQNWVRPPRRNGCKDNLIQICLALLN
jgi:hypothetical protein